MLKTFSPNNKKVLKRKLQKNDEYSKKSEEKITTIALLNLKNFLLRFQHEIQHYFLSVESNRMKKFRKFTY